MMEADRIRNASDSVSVAFPGRVGDRPTFVRYLVLGAGCALAIITYIHRAGFQSISSELLRDLRMNSTHLGAMTAAFMVAYGVFEIPWGRLGDRFGPRDLLVYVVLGGSVMTAAVALVILLPAFFAAQIAFLLLVRFLFGMFQAGTFPILSRLLADWMPTTERGLAQGLIWMSTRAGGALAPILIVPLFQSMRDWTYPLAIGACLGMIWCLIVWPWLRNKPEQMSAANEAERRLIDSGRGERPASHGRAPWGRMLRSSNVWALWMMYGCLGFSGNFFLFQFANYLEETRHFSKDAAKWLTVVPFACGVFACVSGGALSDWLMKRLGNKRLGRRLVGMFGLGFAGVMILLTPWVHNIVLLGVLYGLTFIGNDLSMGPAWAAASDIGERYAGTLAGAMNMSASLMAALAAQMAGHSFQAAKFAADHRDLMGQHVFMTLPFVVFAASYFLGAVCWLRVDVTEKVREVVE